MVGSFFETESEVWACFGVVWAGLAGFGWLVSLEFMNFLYFFELHLVYIVQGEKLIL